MNRTIDKRDALAQIRKAKSAHMRWRAFAQALVSGVAIDDDKIPVKHTDCAFGQWYHGMGKRELGHLDSYDGIDTPHEMLHAIYGRIFETLSQGAPKNGGGFANFFVTKAERSRRKFELAREYMEEMIGVSETLLQALEMLEQEVRDQE